MKNIKHIRSQYFTRVFPAKAKLNLGDTVSVSGHASDITKTVKRNNRSVKGLYKATVVGMQYQSDPSYKIGNYMWDFLRNRRMNRYYVRFSSGDIIAVGSMYCN